MATPAVVPASIWTSWKPSWAAPSDDMGAAMHAVLILLGDRLGLYKAMAEPPVTPAELAAPTGTTERYVREWLNANAAGGYVTYDAATATYTLPSNRPSPSPIENSPAFLPGAFQIISSLLPRRPARSSRPSAPARAWAGTSTTTTSSTAPNASSAPATSPTSSAPGSPRSTA